MLCNLKIEQPSPTSKNPRINLKGRLINNITLLQNCELSYVGSGLVDSSEGQTSVCHEVVAVRCNDSTAVSTGHS